MGAQLNVIELDWNTRRPRRETGNFVARNESVASWKDPNCPSAFFQSQSIGLTFVRHWHCGTAPPRPPSPSEQSNPCQCGSASPIPADIDQDGVGALKRRGAAQAKVVVLRNLRSCD